MCLNNGSSSYRYTPQRKEQHQLTVDINESSEGVQKYGEFSAQNVNSRSSHQTHRPDHNNHDTKVSPNIVNAIHKINSNQAVMKEPILIQ